MFELTAVNQREWTPLWPFIEKGAKGGSCIGGQEKGQVGATREDGLLIGTGHQRGSIPARPMAAT